MNQNNLKFESSAYLIQHAKNPIICNFQYPDGRIKEINTIGKKWATFQAINFNTASQPFYIQMSSDGELLNTPIQYTDKVTFENWLKQGLEQLQNKPTKAQYFNF